jgi:hypothetical protein
VPTIASASLRDLHHLGLVATARAISNGEVSAGAHGLPLGLEIDAAPGRDRALLG